MGRRSVIVERDVEMQTRDGVTLRADVYRPQSAQPLPVLLQRTPYDKRFSALSFALMAADRGYAVVIQDTRGRLASEGEYYPLLHEKADGYDAVEWAAAQPWADGQVGMFGGSYVGYTQLAAASERPPSLKAIAPTMTFCDPYDMAYTGGAYSLGLSVSWALGSDALLRAMVLPEGPEKAARLEQVIDLMDGMASGDTFRRLPVADMPLIGRSHPPSFFADGLAHPTRDAHWRQVACAYESLDLPILHVGGWYDIFAAVTLSDYAGLRRAGNQRQRVLMGPWLHGPFEGLVGDVDFGVRASAAAVLPDEVQFRWFDHWLKGAENGAMDGPPIQLFVMGENRWRTEEEWPLARAQATTFYLHSGGSANTAAGDGALSMQPPSEEPVDSFVYDPRNPVPTRGGGLCCWRAALNAGAFDQRDVEARPDVLVYTTPALEQPVEVTGPVELCLWAATTAPDTDFTAKLVDVGPCGYARNVQDSIVRARFRQGGPQADFIRPNEPTEYVIQIGPTSNVF
ncbi:MAG: CocE/NonD family hydrolase, partial [Anaerolineales bacterium]|nr:CocE/NonD family hydrolase [Anaerolineales bacterium]